MPLFGKRKQESVNSPDPFYGQSMPEFNQPPMPPQGDPQQAQNYGQPQYQEYPAEPQQESFAPQQDDVKDRVEEIAEAIIDEKWNELVKDINKVVEWKERTDMDLTKIQQDIENLKERFESLNKGILGKITEYDQNLTSVGTQIKAMDMAFQKILPTFTENVNKLDRIVKGKK